MKGRRKPSWYIVNRNRDIYQDRLEGRTYTYLAVKYCLSKTQIHNIVTKEKARREYESSKPDPLPGWRPAALVGGAVIRLTSPSDVAQRLGKRQEA